MKGQKASAPEQQSWAQPQASVAPSVKQVDGPLEASPAHRPVRRFLTFPAGALLGSSPCP